jgi:CHAT domain
MKRILILSANPKNTDNLRLDEEIREIQAGLERSKTRDHFEIINRSALRVDDLRRTLLDHDPHILHFSGHGAGEHGLALENHAGQMQLVSTAALAELFGLAQSTLECVVLNACYSKVQAEAIYQQINCVIGMDQAIGDRAAIKFAVGFYDALGANKSYEDAYAFGCNAIKLEGIPESSTPVMLCRQDRQPIEGATVDPSDQGPTIDPSDQGPTVTVTMTAGDNSKQIGQIGSIETFTM